ncbi:ATP-binding protein [Nitrospirillum sp. BR 11828]|uniref:AlbA family DNA-binding domain-containing protein n=1 Tax=Nitrospirillum sp. BR 11828 TaxID=3104325 RepID=UPI002ACA31B3|nr:ATP-binding protein [Nitrospirillum sp. BR 11828]MDZ5648173.1 ATP-binding protein [Nitrospirillum sp. BR 11828]
MVMSKRSIDDWEIAHIKAMLSRGMRNKDIQFFFNRPDRSVNSGRITGIKSGTYSNSSTIQPSSDEALEQFLAGFKASEVSAAIDVPQIVADVQDGDPLSHRNILKLFAPDSSGIWRFQRGESDQHECKENFGFKYSGAWVRAVAALANNRGGYIFFGVRDKEKVISSDVDMSYAVVGLESNSFRDADPADFTKKIKSILDPTPRISSTYVEVGGRGIGVFHVEKHNSRPVIATGQDGDQVKEGDIFFRYPGQSGRIKYSDLRAIFDERDALARSQIIPMVSRLLSLGPERSMILDLQEGVIGDTKNVIMIDDDLLSKVKFIKDGDFNQTDGAPTLKLVGDVIPKSDSVVVVKSGVVTRSDLINDFINQKITYGPKEYIRAALESCQGDWLPIYFFCQAARIGHAELLDLIQLSQAPEGRKKIFNDRASGKKKAYKKATGTPSKIMDAIECRNSTIIATAGPADIAHAVLGFSNTNNINLEYILEILKNSMEIAHHAHDATAMSWLRRALCQIDELFYPLRQ